jgi:hypothetical protein
MVSSQTSDEGHSELARSHGGNDVAAPVCHDRNEIRWDPSGFWLTIREVFDRPIRTA